MATYKTLDGGDSWICQSSLPGKSLDDIVFVDENEGWASMFTKIYHTSNSSESWICQFESAEIGVITDIFFLDQRNGWTLTYDGEIIKYQANVDVSVESYESNSLSYNLNQNYPNPFNSSTTISYSIPEAAFIILKIYDLLGNEIRTLVKDFQQTGNHEVKFNANDLPSGIFLYQLKVSDRFNVTKKMLLLK